MTCDWVVKDLELKDMTDSAFTMDAAEKTIILEKNEATDRPPPGADKGKKSWKDLRAVVQRARKMQMTFSNAVPHSFTFCCLQSRIRLYFLGVHSGGRENTLLYADLDPKAEMAQLPGKDAADDAPLAVNPLITFQGTGTTYSKEEQLLRERKRVGAYGITSYDFDAASRTFAFSCGSSVFTLTDNDSNTEAPPPLVPRDMTANSPGGACIDPKICPGTPGLVAFVRAGDLWLASSSPHCPGSVAKDPTVQRLTFVESLDGVTAGVASFVVQEEFDRYTGFWWRPAASSGSFGSDARSGSAMHLDASDEDDDAMTSSVSSHQILFEEVDESAVNSVNIVSSTDDKDNPKGFDTYKYPRVGSVNAKSELKLIDFVYDTGSGEASEVEELKLETPLEVFYPEIEYLVRAGWTPDGKYVWAQVVNRSQTKLALILIHPQAFIRGKSPVSPSIRPNSTPQAGIDEDMISLDEEKVPNGSRGLAGAVVEGVASTSPSPINGRTSTAFDDDDFLTRPTGWGMWLLLEESQPDIWVNCNDNLRFLPDVLDDSARREEPSAGTLEPASSSAVSSSDSDAPPAKDDRVSFLWASEKSGFNHLYLNTVSLPSVPSRNSDAERLFNMNTPLVPLPVPVLKANQLTWGEWEVGNKDIWIDYKKRLIYFCGTLDTPVENHLYSICIDSPADSIKRITKPGYTHSVTMDSSCSQYISVFSNLSTPPTCHLFSLSPSNSVSTSCTSFSDPPECAALMPPVPVPSDYRPPELFSYQSSRSGREQFGLYYAPVDVQPDRKYPTVLFIYGGPHVQLVTNSFKGLRFLRLNSMASLGIAVLVLDVRGSTNRGLTFEGHLKNRLGTVEIEDHLEGLVYAATKLSGAKDVIDLDRVAIHGWSYGGYLSLMGLVQRPDIFKIALAGGPVTSWEEYDTGYTERYMGTVEENPTGYHKGSVLQRVSEFPDEENRLVLIHGVIDENVHFRHTTLLISALAKACKPYNLQVYPNERHGIRQPDNSEHYETTILSFLLNHL